MTATPAKTDTVILVTNDGMGKSERELQHILAAKYFQLLLDDKKLPTAICFYADGVKLVCEGSPALNQLRALEEAGVHLIVCKHLPELPQLGRETCRRVVRWNG